MSHALRGKRWTYRAGVKYYRKPLPRDQAINSSVAARKTSPSRLRNRTSWRCEAVFVLRGEGKSVELRGEDERRVDSLAIAVHEEKERRERDDGDGVSPSSREGEAPSRDAANDIALAGRSAQLSPRSRSAHVCSRLTFSAPSPSPVANAFFPRLATSNF